MNDRYLDRVESIKRLVSEYEKHGSLIVAYEYENTVVLPDAECPRLIALLRKAEDLGFILILFTGRSNDEVGEIVLDLNSRRIPFNLINESPQNIPFSNRKVFYNILLDGRAGLSEAVDQLESVIAHILIREVI
jgi:hypothetical protein